jgi:hypothetical protein
VALERDGILSDAMDGPLIEDRRQQIASGPRRLPELVGSFSTTVKRGVGLVDQLLAVPVVAGNETG